jgi:hypothetical protein
MTAVALFDAFARARGGAGGGGGGPPDGELVSLAHKLVIAALADLQRLRDYEVQCFAHDWRDADLHRSLTRSLYDLYQQWSTDAEQVLERVRALTAAGKAVADADLLEDACGSVRARLQLTPEQVERATAQARRGETVPAEVLRNELRARLRA